MGTHIKRIGFWMDSIEHIKPYKDTSFALMLAAQELGHELVYLPKYGLYLDHGEAKAIMQEVRVTDGISENFAALGDPVKASLNTLDVVTIRQGQTLRIRVVSAKCPLPVCVDPGLG